jgi:hypothetical protein
MALAPWLVTHFGMGRIGDGLRKGKFLGLTFKVKVGLLVIHGTFVCYHFLGLFLLVNIDLPVRRIHP